MEDQVNKCLFVLTWVLLPSPPYSVRLHRGASFRQRICDKLSESHWCQKCLSPLFFFFSSPRIETTRTFSWKWISNQRIGFNSFFFEKAHQVCNPQAGACAGLSWCKVTGSDSAAPQTSRFKGYRERTGPEDRVHGRESTDDRQLYWEREWVH